MTAQLSSSGADLTPSLLNALYFFIFIFIFIFPQPIFE